MGLFEQMQRVEALVRRPELLADDAPASEDAEVLATIDPQRLEGVAITFANLILGRWWRPRFGATLAALPDPLTAARALVGSPWFERAQGEDETAVVLIQGLLDLLERDELPVDPELLRELLAYEYLLEVGLPRRARGEPIDAAAESALFAGGLVRWLHGGRLRLPLAACAFRHPVSALRDGAAGEAPEALVFLLDPAGATELEVGQVVVDVLDLLAQGADDPTVSAAADEASEVLAWLRELELVA